ncbi:hypothetical protein LTR12_014449 [Friedmanniomyces endolithicus]|nr:hypothetical protein LTR12_014449 [Friedmanniomyces endolithicus]
MGLMDKILHPGSKDQAASQGDQPLYSDSERQRIEQQGNIQNPNTSSSGQTMGDSTGDRSHGLRHPVQSAAGRANDGQYAQAGSYGSGSNNLDPNNDGYGSSGRQKLQAQDPVDPRSIRGQNAIYDNSDRADKHNFLHRDHQGSGKSNDQDLSSQMGRTSLENRDAIPTAGGEKLGGLGSGTDRERYPSQPHHYGRDAALGAGAIGVGEHERRKHDAGGETMSGGLGSESERERQYGQQQHHYGRDAALAGGAGAGAIGLEEHERRKHTGGERMGGLGSGNERRDGQNLSSDDAVLHGGQDVPPNAYYEALKDKDTGHMANTTGQSGLSSKPDHHYGRDAALAGGAGAGALGLEEHERRKHAGGNNMGGLGSGNDQGLQQSGQQQHHYGRDAGVVGGAGAGVIGIEEYERRNKNTGGEKMGGLGSGNQNEPYDSQKQHHYGRDAALAGGALGVGEHEHRKHGAAASQV